MTIKDKLNAARTRIELISIGKKIHQSIDESLRPSLQQMINEQKVALWSGNHRRARQNQKITLQRLNR